MFVLDASVALASILADESNRERAREVLQRAVQEGAVVPGLWHLEIGNVLLVNWRKGRVTWDEVNSAIRHFGALPLITDESVIAAELLELLEMARNAGLTVYDTAYLALAIQRGLPLATFDAKLARAAQNAGVAILA